MNALSWYRAGRSFDPGTEEVAEVGVDDGAATSPHVVGVIEQPFHCTFHVSRLQEVRVLSPQPRQQLAYNQLTVSRSALRACAGVKPISDNMLTCSAGGSGADDPPPLGAESWMGASMSAQ